MVTQEQIIEAITENPELVSAILPTIQTTDAVKNLITAQANSVYQAKIGDEVRSIHEQYDNDLFEVLGERPGQKDGQKQKTYDKMKEIFGELKDLRGVKDSLSKDAKVVELTSQIEKLKAEGGGSFIKEQFDTAKANWDELESGYKSKIQTLSDSQTSYQKQGPINDALSQIKFTPETPESVKKMVIESARQQLLDSSELRDGALALLGKDGKVLMNADSALMTPLEFVMSMDAIKDISLKANDKNGGGANTTIEGGIITTSVEGKDVKKLNIPQGSVKSKVQFQKVTEKALTDAGFTVRDKEWTALKDQAYIEHKVGELPREV